MTAMPGADKAFRPAISTIHLRPTSPTAEEENQAHGWDDHVRCGYLYMLLGADAYLRLDSEQA